MRSLGGRGLLANVARETRPVRGRKLIAGAARRHMGDAPEPPNVTGDSAGRVVVAQAGEQTAVKGASLDRPEVGAVVDERVERRDPDGHGHWLAGDRRTVPGLVGL